MPEALTAAGSRAANTACWSLSGALRHPDCMVGTSNRSGPSDVRLVAVDEAVLAELVAAAVADAAPGEVTPPLAADDAWSQERIAWLRAFHLCRGAGLDGVLGEATWAVVVSGQVVGSVRLKRTPSVGFFEVGIWLTRAVRGQGIGRRAVAELSAAAQQTGATTLCADTRASNAAALAVLRHSGFTLDERADGSVIARASLHNPTP